MWKHPQGRLMFDVPGEKERVFHGQADSFADCRDVREADAFAWPDEQSVDFSASLAEIDRTIAAGQAVLSGTWSCFFHNTANFFGMENCFVRMYTIWTLCRP